MLHLLDDLGFEIHRVVTGSEVEVMVELGRSRPTRGARDSRDHVGAVASLRPLFEPRGIAVVGASRKEASSGMRCSRTCRQRLSRRIYRRQPGGGRARGASRARRSAPSPEPSIGSHLCPGGEVLGAVDDCIAAGVRHRGRDGRIRRDLCRPARHGGRCSGARRRAGVRLVGPNCLGVLSGRPGLRSTRRSPGPARRPAMSRSPRSRVRSASRSWSRPTTSASASRRSSPSATAPTSRRTTCSRAGRTIRPTKVIALYVESFGNPRRFARIARRVTARKPIVALKAGRSAAGRAGRPPTRGAGGEEAAVDALFHQTGVVRIDTVEELFDAARLFAHQPVPAGNRVASSRTRAASGSSAPTHARRRAGGRGAGRRHAGRLARSCRRARAPNPVDVIAATGPARLRGRAPRGVRRPRCRCRGGAPRSDRDDRPGRHRGAVGSGLAAAVRRSSPACLVGADANRRSLNAGRCRRTASRTFEFPESAARALGHAAHLAAFRPCPGCRARFGRHRPGHHHRGLRRRPDGVDDAWLAPARRAADPRRGRHPSAEGRAAPPRRTRPRRVPRHWARPRVWSRSSPTASSTRPTSTASGPWIRRRARPNAFRRSAAAAQHDLTALRRRHRRGAGRARHRVSDRRHGDPVFGPLVAFGAGGIETELAADVTFRITPVTDADADDLLPRSACGGGWMAFAAARRRPRGGPRRAPADRVRRRGGAADRRARPQPPDRARAGPRRGRRGRADPGLAQRRQRPPAGRR